MDQIRLTEENMRAALQQGLQARPTSTSRAEEESTKVVVKKQDIWYVLVI